MIHVNVQHNDVTNIIMPTRINSTPVTMPTNWWMIIVNSAYRIMIRSINNKLRQSTQTLVLTFAICDAWVLIMFSIGC